MTHIHRLEIPIYDSLLCLAYSGAGEKLRDAFPAAVMGEDWFEIGEYNRLEEFLREREVNRETAETMLRQIRSKQLSHGPTLMFEIPATETCPSIQGSFNRWGFTFRSSQPLPPEMDAAISTFLHSFGIGTVESYVQEAP